MPPDPVLEPRVRDPWARLRATTPARIGLARAGDAPALTHVLDLQAAHAAARDAVHAALDLDRLDADLGVPAIRVRSQAADRAAYLRRPDLGRRLDPACRPLLEPSGADIAFVLADGLSATAVQRHAPPLIEACRARLANLRIAPLVAATLARVALADEIGEALQVRICVVLIGERPGLSVADSLGAYLTFAPRPGRRDHERNCISNIHPRGLSPSRAADTVAWLLREALARRLTGVALKDGSATNPLNPGSPGPALGGSKPTPPAFAARTYEGSSRAT